MSHELIVPERSNLVRLSPENGVIQAVDKISARDMEGIFGNRYFGPGFNESAFGFQLDRSYLNFVPFNTSELEQLSYGTCLMYFADKRRDGTPIVMRDIVDLSRRKTNGLAGGIGIDLWTGMRRLFRTHRESNGEGEEHFPDEYYFDIQKIRPGWKLVTEGPIPNSTDRTPFEQTEVMVNFLRKRESLLSDDYRKAIAEFDESNKQIKEAMEGSWTAGARMFSELKICQLARPTPVEVTYANFLLRSRNMDTPNIYYLTNTKAEREGIVGVANCGMRGLDRDIRHVPVYRKDTNIGAQVFLWDEYRRMVFEEDSGRESGTPVKLVETDKKEKAPVKDKMYERAYEVLGEDFLGVEALKKAEWLLGKNAEFWYDEVPPINCTEEDLQFAKKNGEMLIFRPDGIRINDKDKLISMEELQKLFRSDPLGHKDGMMAGCPLVKEDKFRPGWVFVKKDVLKQGLGYYQNYLNYVVREYMCGGDDLYKYGYKRTKRRTLTESVFDTVLYYLNTGKSLLKDVCESTDTVIFIDEHKSCSKCWGWNYAAAGNFIDKIHFGYSQHENGRPGVGAVPTRVMV